MKSLDNLDLNKCSDEELLIISFDNPGAFEVVVKRYQKPFFKKALSILQNSADAEDAVQDAFVKIYTAVSSFEVAKEDSSFRSWAYTVLINTCLTLYNKKKKERERCVYLTEEMEAVIEDVSVKKDRELFEVKEYIVYLLSKLPKLLRRTAYEYFVDLKSYKQISNLESVSEGVIRTRIHRAKRLLRKYYKK